MTNCKYFQQGNCRFGQSCRFKHVYGSQYSYVANTQSHTADVAPDQNDVQALAQVLSDVPAILQGGQWLLTVYSPFKDKANFPGFIDLSPDEIRLFMYEAKASNNYNQAVDYVNSLVEDARYKYEQLVKSPPNPAIIKTIRALNNGEKPSSPFTNNIPANQSNASSVFKSAVRSSVFNQNTQHSNSVFAPSVAKSIFSQANQSVFSQNQQPKEPSNIFAAASQNQFNSQPSSSLNIFRQPDSQNAFANTQSANIFAQAHNTIPDADNFFGKAATQTNIQTNVQSTTKTEIADVDTFFGKNTQTNNQTIVQSTSKPENIFAKANANIFGVSNNEQVNHEGNIYSEIEELSKDDLEAFNDEEFKLGFIPEMAPPKALCL